MSYANVVRGSGGGRQVVDDDSNIIKVPGDGSCMFTSIAWGVGRRGLDAATLRAEVVAHMAQDPILRETLPDLDAFVERMSHATEWGDEPVLPAAAAVVQRHIHVWTPGREAPFTYGDANHPAIHLRYNGRDHYDLYRVAPSLISIPCAPPKERSLPPPAQPLGRTVAGVGGRRGKGGRGRPQKSARAGQFGCRNSTSLVETTAAAVPECSADHPVRYDTSQADEGTSASVHEDVGQATTAGEPWVTANGRGSRPNKRGRFNFRRSNVTESTVVSESQWSALSLDDAGESGRESVASAAAPTGSPKTSRVGSRRFNRTPRGLTRESVSTRAESASASPPPVPNTGDETRPTVTAGAATLTRATLDERIVNCEHHILVESVETDLSVASECSLDGPWSYRDSTRVVITYLTGDCGERRRINLPNLLSRGFCAPSRSGQLRYKFYSWLRFKDLAKKSGHTVHAALSDEGVFHELLRDVDRYYSLHPSRVGQEDLRPSRGPQG